MFNTRQHNYLKASMDAMWLKQKVHQNNIANYETPNFKADVISFRNVLTKKQDNTIETTLIADTSKSDEKSLRLDGNNVDIEKESLEMYRAYVQFSALSQKMSTSFKNIRYAINNTGR